MEKQSICCPSCGVTVLPSWEEHNPKQTKKAALEYRIYTAECPYCEELVVRVCQYAFVSGYNPLTVKDDLIYPQNGIAINVPEEVPKELAQDYKEACLCLMFSAKASATLGRRCLQRILIDAGAKSKNLAGQIDDVINGLPTGLADSLHTLRELGNFAAHPTESIGTGDIINVGLGEAEFVLSVVLDLFDYYYVKPIKQQSAKDKLREMMDAAGKRLRPS